MNLSLLRSKKGHSLNPVNHLIRCKELFACSVTFKFSRTLSACIIDLHLASTKIVAIRNIFLRCLHVMTFLDLSNAKFCQTANVQTHENTLSFSVANVTSLYFINVKCIERSHDQRRWVNLLSIVSNTRTQT